MVPNTKIKQPVGLTTQIGTQMNSQMNYQGTKRDRDTWVANNANTAVFIQSKFIQHRPRCNLSRVTSFYVLSMIIVILSYDSTI